MSKRVYLDMRYGRWYFLSYQHESTMAKKFDECVKNAFSLFGISGWALNPNCVTSYVSQDVVKSIIPVLNSLGYIVYDFMGGGEIVL